MAVKVSVLTPVYNAEPFLAEAIESILAQTYSDFEFLLVDDGSSDSSPQIIRDYAKKDKRIRVLTLPENRGMPYALNYGLKRARAPLIARMDADDIALPECLQVQYNYMQQHPAIGLLGCQGLHFVYEESTRQKKIIAPLKYPTNPKELRLRYQYGFFPTGHNLAMYQRDLAIEVGGYREFFRCGAEFLDLFQRMWDKSPVENLSDTLYWYRLDSPTSLFCAKPHRYVAGVCMSILCSLYRQSGREDPIEAVKRLNDLPTHLGCPKSVTLKDLQNSPYWAMKAIRRQLALHPIALRPRGRLFAFLATQYRDAANFRDGKSQWRDYAACVVARTLARGLALPLRTKELWS